MADYVDLFEDHNLDEIEPDSFISDEILDLTNGLLFDVIQNLETFEITLIDRNETFILSDFDLLILTKELNAKILDILKQAIKLANITKTRLYSKVNCCLDCIRKDLNNINLSLKNEKEHESQKIKERLEFLRMREKELEVVTNGIQECKDDTKNVLEETRKKFLNYQKLYKKCEFYVKNILQKAEKKLQISNIPRDRQEELCVLTSILEERLASYTSIFVLSRKEFEVFENIIKIDLSDFEEDMEIKTNLYITASVKAELAYDKLHSILYEILDFDCAIHGFD